MSSDGFITREDFEREARRFHMSCKWCGVIAVPQLMPLSAELYVRPFLEQHAECKDRA